MPALDSVTALQDILSALDTVRKLIEQYSVSANNDTQAISERLTEFKVRGTGGEGNKKNAHLA